MSFESRTFPAEVCELDGIVYTAGGVHHGIEVQYLMVSKFSTATLRRHRSCPVVFWLSIRCGEGPSKYAPSDIDGQYPRTVLLELPRDNSWSGFREHAQGWAF